MCRFLSPRSIFSTGTVAFLAVLGLSVPPAPAVMEKGDWPWNLKLHGWHDRAIAEKLGTGWFLNVGPTGLRVRITHEHPQYFTVKFVFENSPANGLVSEGDIVAGANGTMLTVPHTFGRRNIAGWEGPMLDMSKLIEDSQGKDGKLDLIIWPGGVEANQKTVTLQLEPVGRFSPTWPFECPRSDKLLTDLCDFLALPALALGDETDPTVSDKAERNDATQVLSEEVRKKLKFPGLTINFKERSVDIESTVCLEAGLLELVACTKDTKEHESIVAIEAQPMHVHTALLLLRAKPGNPAMSKPTDPERTRWVHLPPRGGAVKVSLVFKDDKGEMVERPISDFIEPAGEEYGEGPVTDAEKAKKEKEKFPTNTFLFAGSILANEKPGQPRRYLADQTGNVITIATFGDETLCLPEVHSHENGMLMWAVDSTHLPATGTKVILRLRPVVKPALSSGSTDSKAETATPDK